MIFIFIISMIHQIFRNFNVYYIDVYKILGLDAFLDSLSHWQNSAITMKIHPTIIIGALWSFIFSFEESIEIAIGSYPRRNDPIFPRITSAKPSNLKRNGEPTWELFSIEALVTSSFDRFSSYISLLFVFCDS